MSVNKGDRRESKVQFDATYFKVFDDAVNLTENNFYAKSDVAEKRKRFIDRMGDAVLKSVTEIGTQIRLANSIYPMYQSELEQRRIAQEKAIGYCLFFTGV